MSFSDLKKQSSLGSLTAKLVKEVEKVNNSGNSGADDPKRNIIDRNLTRVMMFKGIDAANKG